MMAAAVKAAETLNHGRARVGSAPETVGLLLADAGYCSLHNLTVPGPDRLMAPGSGNDSRPPPGQPLAPRLAA